MPSSPRVPHPHSSSTDSSSRRRISKEKESSDANPPQASAPLLIRAAQQPSSSSYSGQQHIIREQEELNTAKDYIAYSKQPPSHHRVQATDDPQPSVSKFEQGLMPVIFEEKEVLARNSTPSDVSRDSDGSNTHGIRYEPPGQDLAKVSQRLSRDDNSDVRMVVAIPTDLRLKGHNRRSARLTDGLFCEPISQTAEDVYYHLRLNLPGVDTGSHWVECKIYYVPTEDWCLFRSISGPLILARTNQVFRAESLKMYRLEPDHWSLTLPGGDANSGQRLVARFKLLCRQHRLEIIEPSPISNMARLMGLVLGVLGSTRRSSIQVFKPDDWSLSDLREGQTARILTGKNSSTPDYQVKHVGDVGSTASEALFLCKHSSVSRERLLGKFAVVDLDKLELTAESFKNELDAADKLHHPAIARIAAADGRAFARFIEAPPLSLVGYTKFSEGECLAILKDMSSALRHMEENEFAHRDVRPHNIRFCRDKQRAVLDNLGMTGHFNKAIEAETKVWYLPPEYYKNKKRTHKADIWALGVTMLYVMGAIDLPEETQAGWDWAALDDADQDRRRRAWYRFVRDRRAEVSQGPGAGAGNVVRAMLDPEPTQRLSAGEIKRYLNVPDTEKRRHDGRR